MMNNIFPTSFCFTCNHGCRKWVMEISFGRGLHWITKTCQAGRRLKCSQNFQESFLAPTGQLSFKIWEAHYWLVTCLPGHGYPICNSKSLSGMHMSVAKWLGVELRAI